LLLHLLAKLLETLGVRHKSSGSCK
jgi:hypothetical protein